MLVKLCILTTKSLRLYNKLTVGRDDESVGDFLNRVEENGNKVLGDNASKVEVLAGKTPWWENCHRLVKSRPK